MDGVGSQEVCSAVWMPFIGRRLEAEFSNFLREIAYERQLSLSELINAISQAKSRKVTVASAFGVFVAQHYRAAVSQRC